MKQKLFSILALLLMAVSGAWAQTEELLTTITATGKDTYSETTAGVVTVSHDNDYFDNTFGWLWYEHAGSVTVEAKGGYTITKCVFRQPYKTPFTVSTAPFKVDFIETSEPDMPDFKQYLCQGYMDGVSSIEVYGYAPAAATGYSVTLAEGTEDADKWTVKVGEGEAKVFPVEGLNGGETVTATYSGTKKVKSVKAVKKAAAPTYTLLSAATTEDVGKVVCAAGHLHDAKTAVPDGCTAVGILGKVTSTGHGLILALQNATNQNWNTINGWNSVTDYAGTTLIVLPDNAARGTNLTSYTTLGETAVSNWAVAQKSDYEAIFENLGSTTGNVEGKTYDDNVNAYITTGVGGTAISDRNWSLTMESDGYAYYFESLYWSVEELTVSLKVRPVLGF